ncbi:MAG: glycoside hydrolase family 65 protein [Candidatus Omnitrophica bacterium]|nr:glycoside hydrolase family 65 protein [Candidatus Omnitrophota bacterium]
MNPWKLTYNRFDPEKESLREALCTLGNGYFGTRGAVSENVATKVHYPGTYIAGVYNALTTDIAGRIIVNEDFVNCPNWLMLNYRINDGPWFNRHKVKILSWKVELNMLKGILSRRMRWQDDQGRITLIENHRIVSMADPHLCALRCTITPENYSGKLTVRSGLDGLILNAGVERYRQLKSRHLEPIAHGSFGEDGISLQMKTNQSQILVAQAQRTFVHIGEKEIKTQMRVQVHGRERIIQQFSIDVQKGKKYSIEKLVSIYTSRDHGIGDCIASAQEKVSMAENFESIYKPHRAKWQALWKKFDIEIDGDDFVQQVLRLHTFHLLQVASTYNEDIDAGLPARGLHGEAYRGHIFWDELYAFPFYTLHAPEITRSLLMYRYRRLIAAKDNALQHGHQGAMYPWQSASTGEETTQVVHLNPVSGTWGPDYSCLQRHVSIAIAYNVWTYYVTSGDRDFLDQYGAEILLEIAHFWSSMSIYNNRRRRYEIHGVMGPDEFHEKYPRARKGGLNNNAYTNVMVVWVIEKVLGMIDTFAEEERSALMLKTNISEDELSRWRHIIKRMYVPVDRNGLIHQFEGYLKLKELDWDEYRAKYENVHRIDRILKAEGQSPDSFKAAKQADTLMLFYVLNETELKHVFHQLGYPFNKEMMKMNYEYYIERTSHGSTLSRIIHAYIGEKLNHPEIAMQFFQEALESDIYDTQGGTTQEGIHVGVMGGTIDLCLRFFAGLNILSDKISLSPKLPAKWKKMKFQVRYRNVWFSFLINKDSVRVKAAPVGGRLSLQRSASIPIEINKVVYELRPRKAQTISL